MSKEVTNDDLIESLDAMQPSWHLDFADQRDLEQLARKRITEDALRRRLALKLGVVVRAYLEAQHRINVVPVP